MKVIESLYYIQRFRNKKQRGYRARFRGKFPRKMMSICPNIDDLEELSDKPEDTKEESTQW